METKLRKELDINANFERRRIYLFGEVDVEMSRTAIMAIHKMDETDGPIEVWINSEGGSESAGYAIYDALSNCRNRVVTIGYGEVLSIAAAIFQAGDVRYLSANSEYMIHNGTVGTGGEEQQQTDLIDTAERIKKSNRRYYKILSNASKLSYKEVEEACQRDSYYSPKEAKSVGFCDHILKSTRTIKRKKKLK